MDYGRVHAAMHATGRPIQARLDAALTARNQGVVADGGHVCDSMDRETRKPCTRIAVAFYMTGWRCHKHSPAVLAGRTVPVPDPSTTMDAMTGPRHTPRHPATERTQTIVEATAQRDVAMNRADANATTVWKNHARHAIWHLANSRPTFTTDDVWTELTNRGVASPAEPRALGPVIIRALRANAIRDTGRMTKSVRRHAARIPIYERNPHAY